MTADGKAENAVGTHSELLMGLRDADGFSANVTS